MHCNNIHKHNDQVTGEGMSLFHQPSERSHTENIQTSKITITPTHMYTHVLPSQ